jgi:O-antigen ligase
MSVVGSYRLSYSYERLLTSLAGVVSLIFMMSTTLRSLGMLLIILALLAQQEQRLSLKQCLMQPWMVMILLWLAWIFCAGFWSDASASVICSLDKKYLKLLYLPFFVVLMRQAVYRAWAMHGLIWGVASSALISCLAYASVPGFEQLNADQIFVNHVEYSIFASVAVMLLMFQWSQVASSSLQSTGYLLGFILLSFQLFWVNGGRMGYLIYSLSVMLSLLLWFSWQRIGWMLLALALFIIVGYECSPTLHRRVFDFFYELQTYQDLHQGSNAIGARLQFHALAKQLWWHHPWMGSGIGSFSHEVVSRGLFEFMGWNQLADPHSQ